MEYSGKSKPINVRHPFTDQRYIFTLSYSDTSITDIWSRMISYHFLNETTRSNFFTNTTGHGAGQLWSQLTQTSLYQEFAVPFPILYSNSRPVGSNDTGFLSLSSTVYEVNSSNLISFVGWFANMCSLSLPRSSLVPGIQTYQRWPI
jgi:lysophospholipase